MKTTKALCSQLVSIMEHCRIERTASTEQQNGTWEGNKRMEQGTDQDNETREGKKSCIIT